MRNLHIMHNDKFNKTYIEFINKEFSLKEHNFIFLGGYKSKEIIIPKLENIEIGIENGNKINKLFNWLALFQKNVYRAEKIYLHGLFNPIVVLFLFLQPWLLKKCNWIIWGGDLYFYQIPKLTLKSKAYEFMRAVCIKKISKIITSIDGEYDLAKEFYQTKAKIIKARYPLAIDLSYLDSLYTLKKENKKVLILLGNSGDPSNNHIEVLEALSKFKEKQIEIICPLSYGGSKKYKESVIKMGKTNFENKFTPLLEFLDKKKYENILSQIDIAVMAHNRQQAMNNMRSLLYIGKKVYLKKETTSYSHFSKEGIKIFDFANIKMESFEEFIDINSTDAMENRKILKETLSNNYTAEMWRNVYKS